MSGYVVKYSGTVLKRSLAYKPDTGVFSNEKGKVVSELGDEKWRWDLALLYVISATT